MKNSENNSPFGFDKPEDSPGFLLWQVSMTWQRAIKQTLDRYDISHSQFVIMALLLWFEKQHHKTAQTDIIKMSKLDKMTVSKSLKKLAQLELVTRSENIEDTRAKITKLTSKGEDLIYSLIPIVEEIDKRFLAPLNENEKNSTIAILRKLAD